LKTTKVYDVGHLCTRCLPVRKESDHQKKDNPDLEGSVAKRTFFLIDKQGIVRGKWIGEDLTIFSTEVLLKAAREIAGKS
jgi:peroxiredoxin